MTKKDSGATLDPEAKHAWSWPDEAKEGWKAQAPYDTVFVNGHPFTVEPPGGVFKKGVVYVVEKYETLQEENRGDWHRDGRVFHYHRVGFAGAKPSLIIRR